MQRKAFYIFLILLGLAGCSPHPGAGGWHAVSVDAVFERLEIRYGGNADLYSRKADNTAAWRCFWGAETKRTASLKCIDAGNADNEQFYVFEIDAATNEGTLTLEGQILGVYAWQPPTEPSSE